MRSIASSVFVVCLFAASCSRGDSRKAVLVSDGPWNVGEAKVCRYDGKYNEGPCWPVEKSAERGVDYHRYWATARFEGPVHFDEDQWASVDCRLDTLATATCRQF